MNSYAAAIALPGAIAFLAALFWSRPWLVRAHQVRRFRKDLSHLELMAAAWSFSQRQGHPQSEHPSHRPRPAPRKAAEADEAQADVDDDGEPPVAA
ncbi:MAG: hypothetical protein AB1673_13015 [Actinomycetota bacterium]|jgi:hypothetical protein